MLRCPYRDVLYGGAAGGGKSDGLLGDFVSGVEQYGSAWHGLLIRRSFPMLEELESRALDIFSPHYGVDSYKVGRRTWYFKTKKGVATLKLRAVEDMIDARKHQGQSYTWFGADELTQWPDSGPIDFIMHRVRPRNDNPLGGAMPLYQRFTANPGDVGHNWVKERYRIGVQDPMTPWTYMKDKKSGRSYERVFIPANVTDNRILLKNDPGYRMTLDAIEDPILRRALLHGDWNIAQGAAFSEFDPDVHVVPYHEPPPGSVVYRALDWGYDKPFGCVWIYVDFDGNLTQFNEMYGYGGGNGKGSKLDPEILADRIRDFEKSRNITPIQSLLDPQCWAEHGNQTIFSLLGGAKMGWQPWPKGKESRQHHKQLVHSYLKVVNGVPRYRITANCIHTIRTLPVLPHHPTNILDIDTRAEDHLYDAIRGVLASINPLAHIGRRIRYEQDQLAYLEQDAPSPGDDSGFSRFGGH